MLIPILTSFLLASATNVSPIDAAQQARLAALLVWADAYRNCYQPIPYGLSADRRFTSECIRLTLTRDRSYGSPDQQAAMAALIDETPRLVDALNAPSPGAAPPPPPSDPPAHPPRPHRKAPAPSGPQVRN